MKKILALATALAALMPVFAQKAVIKGEMKDFGDNAKVIVSQIVNNRMVPQDTVAVSAKGKYKIEVTPAQPTLYLLSFGIDRGPIVHVMAMPDDNLTMDMELTSSTMQTQQGPMTIQQVRITNAKGSKDVELYREFNNAMLEPDALQRAETLIDQHSNCLMSAFLVTLFENDFENHYKLYEKVRDSLIGKYPADPAVQYVDHKLKTTLVPGMTAPEIVLNGVDGKERRLSDLRGKVVMIDFWASWCRPCRAENPNVVKLYNKYKDKGFEVFSVSLDKNHDDWVRAIQSDNLSWENHVSDLKGWQSAAGQAYGIMSIPATVLLDREGRIIARNLRGGDLEEKLKEIFEQ